MIATKARLRPFGSEMKASDIVRQVACGRQQVALNRVLVSQHVPPCARSHLRNFEQQSFCANPYRR